MAKRLSDRLEHAWNAFVGKSTEEPVLPIGGMVSYGPRPERTRTFVNNAQRMIAPILTQIAIDAAGVELRHVRVGDNNEYIEDMPSTLNDCLLVSPNIDQSPAQFRQDIVMTMLEDREGVVAVVPVETDLNPNDTGGYDIRQLRCGKIVKWMPQHVRISLYDDNRGVREEVVMRKQDVAIVENPLYPIINEPNSTLQRLIHKLGQVDVTDDRLASGKLDIILQFPYQIKSERRVGEARQRIRDLEDQVVGSQYGIGYIDGNERITQLNRPSENNLLEQVKSLEERLYSQLGLTKDVFFGTADEAAMLNYHNRTVFPIVRAIQEEMHRKFLTKTARTRKQAIKYFKNPFTLVPVSQIAEIADKFTRNEIMAPNEFRPIVGLRPVSDPKANELRNRNMPEVLPKEEEPRQLDPPKKQETQMEGKPTEW